MTIKETKKWYKSKTVWFNILNAIAAFGAMIVGDGIINDPVTLKYILLVVAAINVALRLVTDTGVRK